MKEGVEKSKSEEMKKGAGKRIRKTSDCKNGNRKGKNGKSGKTNGVRLLWTTVKK